MHQRDEIDDMEWVEDVMSTNKTMTELILGFKQHSTFMHKLKGVIFIKRRQN